MKARILVLALLVVFLLPGCFGKFPDLRKDITRLKENLRLIKKDYEPLKNKDGKVVGKPAHRPFGDNEADNDKSCKNRLNLFDESDKLCDDMIAASGSKKEDKKDEEEKK